MLIFVVALAAIAALGVWCLVRTRNERSSQETRSAATAAGVWAVYLSHLSLTVAASVAGTASIPLHPLIQWGVGLFLFGAGIVLFWLGVWSFRSFERVSGLDADTLVTTGIYRWSRNPQNVGWGVFLFGMALLGQSGLALLLAALFWLVFIVYVRMEERYLEHVFGDQYRQYMRWSRRYFGPPQKDLMTGSGDATEGEN